VERATLDKHVSSPGKRQMLLYDGASSCIAMLGVKVARKLDSYQISATAGRSQLSIKKVHTEIEQQYSPTE